VVKLNQLSFNGRSLTSEFTSPWHNPELGIDLPSVGSCLLLLLIGLLWLTKEPSV
jgi:hypothetical protein